MTMIRCRSWFPPAGFQVSHPQLSNIVVGAGRRQATCSFNEAALTKLGAHVAVIC